MALSLSAQVAEGPGSAVKPLVCFARCPISPTYPFKNAVLCDLKCSSGVLTRRRFAVPYAVSLGSPFAFCSSGAPQHWQLRRVKALFCLKTATHSHLLTLQARSARYAPIVRRMRLCPACAAAVQGPVHGSVQKRLLFAAVEALFGFQPFFALAAKQVTLACVKAAAAWKTALSCFLC